MCVGYMGRILKGGLEKRVIFAPLKNRVLLTLNGDKRLTVDHIIIVELFSSNL